MKKGFVIAIDGPVASGKGTIAQKLAQKIHALNFNSGGVYRAYAYKLLQQGITTLSEKNLSECIQAGDVEISITDDTGGFEIMLDGKK
ncbi:MAG TPA: (d)CMP kinase, partial [Candidatus Levybacteria bacterium]|nr:(d)CMP kinase [Candidatus Levybacteria bacterium]